MHRKYQALVERLEPYARRQPANYRLEVALLAALGYAYVGFIAVALLALTALIVTQLLALHFAPSTSYSLTLIALVPLSIAVLRVLVNLFRVEPISTEGYLIHRSTAPELFAMLDADAKALRAPKLDQVLLTGEFNASLYQRPRFGLFGRTINYLEVGLPVMKSLSPEQFRSVLGHELGHLSANHSRFCSWIYSNRLIWSQMLESLERSESIVALVLRPFVSWYSPYFNAYTFVLARSNEYEADRAAAQIAGSKAFAQALVTLRLQSQFLNERFWPVVFRQANRLPEPPRTPFAAMFDALAKGPQARDCERWFEEALAERTTVDDTHPCLRSRLAALGFSGVADGPLDMGRPPIELPQPVARSAADLFLPRLFEPFVKRLEVDWRKRVTRAWHKRHAEAQTAGRRLEELRGKSLREDLELQEQWERIALTAEFYGRDATAPILTEVARRHPDDSRCLYALGLLLLEHDDVAGVRLVERAMSLDSEIIESGSNAVYYFMKRTGRSAEAVNYRKRAEHARAVILELPFANPRPVPTPARTFRPAAGAQALRPERTITMDAETVS